ncbi:MAG: PssD/Cps14F family polysaccharide biosynthesis glycosyltransferase [Planctomycetota bacterium]|jgi:UDP-N-acetylglucosamine:LPS N-acetylglucosamine transferase
MASKKTDNNKLKICLVASAGGHLSQLLKTRDAWEVHETSFVTTTEVVKEQLSQYGQVYVVGECNHRQPFRLAKVLVNCTKIALSRKFDVIISTGAAVGCIMCYLCKIFGVKIIWIDSITNAERLSLSGRLVRRISDLFLVQWPHLAKQYRNAEFIGTLI